MKKRAILSLLLLSLIPFTIILGFHLIHIPTFPTLEKLSHYLSRLEKAKNHYLENGEFRRRIWLDAEPWQLEILGKSIPISVPSCWNSIPGLGHYQGKAKYVYPLPELKNDKRKFLCFRAVSYFSKVALVAYDENSGLIGEFLIGEHHGAYTPFEFEITNSLKEIYQLNPAKLVLSAKVDNRLSRKTLPGKYPGWKHIGGIYQEVYLEERSQVFIKEAQIIAEPDGHIGELLLEIKLDNAFQEKRDFEVEIEFSGLKEKWIKRMPFQLSGEKEFELSFQEKIYGIKPWSPEKPALYGLFIRLFERFPSGHNLVDQQEYQIGFRRISVEGNQIYLNGERIKIKGISRHHFYPFYYQSVPKELIEEDFKKIKELGANLVRLGHYPNHPYVLKICDELGLLVWEEIPAWGKLGLDYGAKEVIESAQAQIKEMLLRDRNHPSLVLVGLANEIPSNRESGGKFIKELAEFSRPLLSGQLLSITSDRFEKDRAVKYIDLIGFNCYFGWYGGKIDQLNDKIRVLTKAFPDKPILISEYGADAVLGRHGAIGDIWTEENQARFLEASYKIIETAPGIAGGIIWLFADYPDPIRVFNPEAFVNQKGLLDQDRKEKLGFQVARSLYLGLPISYYARSQLFPRIRDGALSSLVIMLFLFGLFSPIPERWVLIIPSIRLPGRLLKRAILIIAFQTLIYELIFRGYLSHQPFALPISFSYPSMKLLQVIFNSHFRFLFIFFGLLWLWGLMSQFFLLFNPDKFQRHPFELSLGIGDPFALIFPYPLVAFFPVLVCLSLNLPNLVLSGGFQNQFTTLPWLFFQVGYFLLLGFGLIKIILVLAKGLGVSWLKACLVVIFYSILIYLILAIWGIMLVLF